MEVREICSVRVVLAVKRAEQGDPWFSSGGLRLGGRGNPSAYVVMLTWENRRQTEWPEILLEMYLEQHLSRL